MLENNSYEIMSIEEVCEYLAIGKNTAYRLLNSHEIDAFKIGRIWKIPKASLWAYIKNSSSAGGNSIPHTHFHGN